MDGDCLCLFILARACFLSPQHARDVCLGERKSVLALKGCEHLWSDRYLAVTTPHPEGETKLCWTDVEKQNKSRLFLLFCQGVLVRFFLSLYARKSFRVSTKICCSCCCCCCCFCTAAAAANVSRGVCPLPHHKQQQKKRRNHKLPWLVRPTRLSTSTPPRPRPL